MKVMCVRTQGCSRLFWSQDPNSFTDRIHYLVNSNIPRGPDSIPTSILIIWSPGSWLRDLEDTVNIAATHPETGFRIMKVGG